MCAETNTAPAGRREFGARQVVHHVDLVDHQQLRRWRPPVTGLVEHLAEHRAHRRNLVSGNASEPSTTWISRSASATSSMWSGNASTSCGQVPDKADGVGEHHFAPVVQARASGRRVEGREQRVLDQHPGPGHRVDQARLTGIGVADDRDRRHPLRWRSKRLTVRAVFISRISRRNFAIRSRIRRRSVSIFVSPGRADPRRRCCPPVHRPGATSTDPSHEVAGACTPSAPTRPAPYPSRLVACWANMSGMRAVRSITLTLTTFSGAVSWAGVSSPSAITVSAPVATTISRSSSALPEPM